VKWWSPQLPPPGPRDGANKKKSRWSFLTRILSMSLLSLNLKLAWYLELYRDPLHLIHSSANSSIMNQALSRFIFRSASALATGSCKWMPVMLRRSYSSHSPVSPKATHPRKKVTINTLRTMHANSVPIAMMTAHDFPSGLAADQAHMDVILVGDSLAMVGLGMEVCVCVTTHHSQGLRNRLSRAKAWGSQDTNQLKLDVITLA